MVALAMIDDVQDRIGLELPHAILNRRQVGRRVKEGPVALANDHRRGEAVEKQAQRPLALPGQATLDEVLYDPRQTVVIETFAQFIVERDPQPLVELLDLLPAVGQERLP